MRTRRMRRRRKHDSDQMDGQLDISCLQTRPVPPPPTVSTSPRGVLSLRGHVQSSSLRMGPQAQQSRVKALRGVARVTGASCPSWGQAESLTSCHLSPAKPFTSKSNCPDPKLRGPGPPPLDSQSLFLSLPSLGAQDVQGLDLSRMSTFTPPSVQIIPWQTILPTLPSTSVVGHPGHLLGHSWG